MKKFVCILVLACVVMGGAFAQAKPAARGAKNAIAMDVFRLFDGLTSFEKGTAIGATVSFSYERSIVPHWSLGPNLDLGFFGSTGYFLFNLGVAAEGRYYPFANFDKFFVGTSLGFTVSVDSYKRSLGYGYGYYDYYNLYGLLDYALYDDPDYYGPGTAPKKSNAVFGLSVMIKAGYKLITSKKFYLEPSLAYGYRGGGGVWQGGLRLGFAF